MGPRDERGRLVETAKSNPTHRIQGVKMSARKPNKPNNNPTQAAAVLTVDPDTEPTPEPTPDAVAEMHAAQPLTDDQAEAVNPTPDTNPSTPEALDVNDAIDVETPADVFATAYNAAVDSADVNTGTIPSGPADALRIAYRGVPSGKRGKLATSTQADAMAQAMADKAMARFAGISAAAAILADVDSTPARTPAVVIDPTVQALAQVTSLRALEAWILASLPTDAAASVAAEADAIMAAGSDSEYVIDWKASGLPTSGAKRTGSKRVGLSGPRASGAGVDLGAAILGAFEGHDAPMTAADLNKACERSGGAVPNAADRLVTSGSLVRTTVKRGDRDVAAWSLA